MITLSKKSQKDIVYPIIQIFEVVQEAQLFVSGNIDDIVKQKGRGRPASLFNDRSRYSANA